MEIRGEDGTKMELKNGTNTVFGRGTGFNTEDRTVSRRHVLFHLETPIDPITENQTDPCSSTNVSFQVIGKNPIWVRSGKEIIIKVFRKFEKGEVASGDWFCVSSQTPVWFNLKSKFVLESENGSELCGDLDNVGVSQIDPVKEFGFLVIGHEFDCYPKQRIHAAKDWDWFLEEPEQDSEDDESEKERGGRKKRTKKVGGNDEDDDEDWMGESEDDKEVVAKVRKVEPSKYLTRSKDSNETCQDTKRKKGSGFQMKCVRSNEEQDDDDDEILGGFIVNDEDDEEQVEENDEEEEFIDNEDDDEEELDD